MVLSPIYSYKSLSYKIVIKEKKVSELTNNLLGLVPKNEKTYGSTLGLRLSKSVRNSYYFNYTSVIFSQIIGHLLGDGCLTMSWSSINPFFIFTQASFRFEYVWFVFENLKILCKSMPKLGKSKRNGMVYYHIQVYTRSFSFLKEIYNAFYYKNNEKQVIKVIPKEIYYWLNPIVLAYWAMDDGAKTTSGSGFYLHTKGFEFLDVYYLVGIIHYKYNLICTVQNHKGRPVVYITAISKIAFFKIIKPYFHDTMLYKLK
jgi:hypothetical protein